MNLKQWCDQQRGRIVMLATSVELPVSFVSNVVAGKKTVPLDHCPYIQLATGNEVSCEDLRPDKAEFFALVRSLPPGEQLAQPAAPAGQPQGA